MWKDIHVIEKLSGCNSEKGKNIYKNKASTWPNDSVFGVLSNYIKSKKKTIDYLVCDDMGTEIADFIAIESSNKKIIYIHCKYNKSDTSASTFEELCGQAMKNVRYIIESWNENNIYLQDRKSKWDIKWPYFGKDTDKSNKGKINRCIKGGSASEIFGMYKSISKDPECIYEVWLVHSGLSHSKLEAQLCKEAQEEHVPQLIWLLQATQDYISDAGANLKIFCSQ